MEECKICRRARSPLCCLNAAETKNGANAANAMKKVNTANVANAAIKGPDSPTILTDIVNITRCVDIAQKNVTLPNAKPTNPAINLMGIQTLNRRTNQDSI